MKLFYKKKNSNGEREVYFFGFKIYEYIGKSFIKNNMPTMRLDTVKYKNIANAKNVKNLILGSSHAMNGFVPKQNDYNLGGSSQDLYISYNLYKYMLAKKHPNLENIILFYSPFSPGFQLCKTNEAFKCIPYKIFYDIDYQEEAPKSLKHLERCLSPILKNTPAETSDDYRGKSCFYQDKNEICDVASIARRWLKHNRRNSSQHEYIKQFVCDTVANNHKLYVIIPPMRADLRLLLPNKNVLFSELFKLQKQHPQICIIDYYDSELFEIIDFKDCDHLNELGGTKLSNLIHQKID